MTADRQPDGFDADTRRYASKEAPEPAETAYFCSHDGYSPNNRGNWCDLGCGRDYNRMIAVPQRHVDKLRAEALAVLERHGAVLLADNQARQREIDLLRGRLAEKDEALRLARRLVEAVKFEARTRPHMRDELDDLDHAANNLDKALHRCEALRAEPAKEE